jgi:carbon storage regulator CsrA
VALVIRRKEGESFLVGDSMITIARVEGKRISIAIAAPEGVKVLRSELAKKEATTEAAQ